MLIYVEKQALELPQTKKILEKYWKTKIIYIDNYKNIFDKSFKNLDTKKSLILAKLNSKAISGAPAWYGHTFSSYFFKTGLNCVFDCSYCYLKWAFKNDNMVLFLNYEDIKNEIEEKISFLQKELPETIHWFYSWDYSDIVWIDNLSWFCEEFIPFFEKFSNVMMEIRTKSANVKSFLDLWFVPKNTEISFSLNPKELIEKYEKWTSSLEQRVKAINILLEKWFKVWLRFLPILPVKNYKELYSEFIKYVEENIDKSKIYSSFASGLLYTKKDYNKILQKYPELDILYMLELENWDFYRESKKFRTEVYEMFKRLDKRCIFCLEN